MLATSQPVGASPQTPREARRIVNRMAHVDADQYRARALAARLAELKAAERAGSAAALLAAWRVRVEHHAVRR